MKRLSALLLILALCLALSGCGKEELKNPYEDIPKPTAVMTMATGETLTFTLDPASAPNTVSNFISLANSGYYDGLKIDYIYPTYFMRGGDPDGDGTGGPDYTIDGEFKKNGFELNDLKHTRGVISMCHLTDDYNSAGSQFFIMLSEHSEYNDEFAAFGYIEPYDQLSFDNLTALSTVTTDNSYRPVVRNTIASIRVDTKGYVYTVVKSGSIAKTYE